LKGPENLYQSPVAPADLDYLCQRLTGEDDFGQVCAIWLKQKLAEI
jgi:hypothetical protein